MNDRQYGPVEESAPDLKLISKVEKDAPQRERSCKLSLSAGVGGGGCRPCEKEKTENERESQEIFF